MNVQYDTQTDLLYLRFDARQQPVTNRRVADDIVLDLGKNGALVGIEIMDASRHLDMRTVLPVRYDVVSSAANAKAAVREGKVEYRVRPSGKREPAGRRAGHPPSSRSAGRAAE